MSEEGVDASRDSRWKPTSVPSMWELHVLLPAHHNTSSSITRLGPSSTLAEVCLVGRFLLPMASHIMWQNAEKTVTLTDIPRSTVEAQGFNSPAEYNLLSCQPRAEPYPSSEPKSAAAKAKLMGNTVDEALHATYREVLTEALQDVSRHHSSDWCLPRPFVEDAMPPAKKRKLGEVDHAGSDPRKVTGNQDAHRRNLPDHYLSSLARSSRIGIEVVDPFNADRAWAAQSDPRSFSNHSDQHVLITASGDHASHKPSFRMPPKSTFYLGDCTASYEFRKAVRENARQSGRQPDFDFILLDPPWPNRSIKRTHKTAGATYRTSPSLDDLTELIFDMQLESLMAENALVGVWVTNKQAVRETILCAGGFFDCWDLALVEEWIWLKTTNSGDPTSGLDATWKKPYEVLLLGRKRSKDGPDAQAGLAVKRKVIIGVPDLHSRKPCLKSLVEPMMPNAESYNALEVFARHLVAGWTSWGDECIKFNWDGYWNR